MYPQNQQEELMEQQKKEFHFMYCNRADYDFADGTFYDQREYAGGYAAINDVSGRNEGARRLQISVDGTV